MKTSKSGRKFIDSIPGCLVLFFITVLGWSLLSYPVSLLTELVPESNPGLYTVVSYAHKIYQIIPGLIFILVYKPDRSFFKMMALKGKSTVKISLIGLVLGLFCNGFCVIVSQIKGDILLSYNSPNWFYILLAFIAVFLQSGSEEFICRFFLYGHLKRGYKSPWPAIIVPSLIFSALHLMNPGADAVSTIHSFVIGIVWALMVYITDSFWMACFYHTAWNYTQSILFGLPNSGLVFPLNIFKLEAASAIKTISYDPEYGVEASVLALSLNTILLIVLLYLFIKKRKAEKASLLNQDN